jgi:hypothetical protein
VSSLKPAARIGALLFTALLALVQPTRADLVWSGSQPLRRAEVDAAMAKLPARGKSVPAQIWVIGAADWPAVEIADGDDGLLGLYSDGRIVLNGGFAHLDVVAAHEFGHHVWFQALRPYERHAWRLFWRHHLRMMPGAYARGSAVEGWADCYAATFVGVATELGDKPIPMVVQTEIRSFFP